MADRLPDMQHLLAEAAWLRGLARRLARDEGDADDAVQETWVAALRQPPDPDRPAKPWLLTVLRHAFQRRGRTEERRQSREQVVADLAPGSHESAEEALARLELHRLVAELVADLEEPYRSTLVLRFFEGRSGVEIARRAGVPEGTVRWRLSEGLQRLRARLDQRLGGSGEWRSLVLAPPPYWKGALGMKLGSKGGVAIVFLMLAGAAVLVSTRAGRDRPGPELDADAILRRAPSDVPSEPGSADGTSPAKGSRPPPRFVAPSPATADDSRRATTAPPGRRPTPAIPLARRYDLTREELEALARNCEVRPDLPGVRTVNDVPMGWLDEKDLPGLRPGERALVRTALRDYRDRLNDLGRRWYFEVTADSDGARGLDFLDFSNPDHPSVQRIAARLTAAQIGEGARRAAEELAGWRSPGDAPPSDPAVASVAAFYRREYALADELEHDLASRLGADRARELRRGQLAGHTRRAGCP